MGPVPFSHPVIGASQELLTERSRTAVYSLNPNTAPPTLVVTSRPVLTLAFTPLNRLASCDMCNHCFCHSPLLPPAAALSPSL